MKIIKVMIAACVLLSLPLAGVWWGKKPLGDYTEFPPLTMHVQHAGFMWPVFIALAAIILAVVLPFFFRILRSLNQVPVHPYLRFSGSFFPWWGWAGLVAGIGFWVLAWNRFEWFEPFQRFTFSPLWFAYILVINALTYWRTGRCMMIDRTGYFLRLFPLSAAFWWFFEYLNRFVQNWYYEGVGGLSALQYFVFATLPFATVLPAVMGTYELLQTFPRFSAGLDDFTHLEVKRPKITAFAVLVLFGAGLAGIGLWPDYLFPMLWLSPLLIITSIQAVRGRPTIFAPVRNGDWQKIFLLAMSALVCGFFWEMWNYYSLAKWLYAVPFVGKFHMFEMPVLGYAGYLPFGLECAVVSALVEDGREREEYMNKTLDRDERALSSTRNIYFLNRFKLVNTAIIILSAVYFFIVPGFLVLKEISRPDIRKPGVPALAWRMHRELSPKFEKWARARIASGKAAHLQLADVPSTEWPMFGCVFYLMATENLQREWEKDHGLSRVAPRVYARGTIDAAIDLVMDPVHHTWVKQHWGRNYMHRENVFFRSLIIRAITSHEKITRDGKYLDVLKDQTLTLAADLDKSKHGVLDDYPAECYPIDVLASIAWIKEASQLLGIDNSAFVDRAIRGFEGRMLDGRGLPPFVMDSATGTFLPEYFGDRYRCSRGTGNSWVLIFTPDLWPEAGARWYAAYEKYFWQDKWWAKGFREFPNDLPGLNYTFDIDSGPIIAGFSPAADAFGVAAARANGRFDHAFVLTAQVLASCWPLLDGTMLGPRILSSQAHAPYLGESAICFFLTQQPAAGISVTTGGKIPPFVFILVVIYYWGIGVAVIAATWSALRRWKRDRLEAVFPGERIQLWLWCVFYVTALLAFSAGYISAGIIAVLLAQFVPRYYLRG